MCCRVNRRTSWRGSTCTLCRRRRMPALQSPASRIRSLLCHFMSRSVRVRKHKILCYCALEIIVFCRCNNLEKVVLKMGKFRLMFCFNRERGVNYTLIVLSCVLLILFLRWMFYFVLLMLFAQLLL